MRKIAPTQLSRYRGGLGPVPDEEWSFRPPLTIAPVSSKIFTSSALG